jgi:hypothetical protein
MSVDMPSRERMYASVAIATAWAALAVVFGAYALVRESAGAMALALVMLWLTRNAWIAAWSMEEEDGERADVPFRF